MVHERLQFSLLPRSSELTALHQLIEEGKEGTVNIAFITGPSGTGKSTVLKSLLKTDGFWYGVAKFEQRRPATPFPALRSLLSEVCLKILASSSTLIDSCRDAIRKEVLASHKHVLLILIPELTGLMELNSTEQELSQRSLHATGITVESLNVVKFGLRSFLRAIATVLPVLLCLDDIMWSDEGTLELLEFMLTDPHLTRVVLCATYQPDKVFGTHPLVKWKETMERHLQRRLNVAQLQNLSFEEVQELMSQSNFPMDDTPNLTELLFDRTHGNLLFLTQLLSSFQDDGVFTLLDESWQWEKDKIEPIMAVSGNFNQVISARISKLSEGVLNVLKLASCFGARFDYEAISICKSVFDVDVAARALEEAKNQEFIETFEDSYKFKHDVVCNGVYRLLPEGDELKRIHWKMGCLLMESRNSYIESERTKFECVDHLNMGVQFVESVTDRLWLAELNLELGRKAAVMCAFKSASRYFKAGIDVLGGTTAFVVPNYRLACDLYSAHAQAEFCAGQYENSTRVAKLVITNANSDDDMLPPTLTLISCLVAEGKDHELGEMCLTLLNQLGERMPKNPTKVRNWAQWTRMKMLLKEKTDEEICSLPVITDASKVFPIKILCEMIFSVGQIELPKYAGFMLNRMIQLTFRYGMTKWSPEALALAGAYLVAYKQDIKEGYRLGKLAQDLVSRHKFIESKSRTYFWVSGFSKLWIDPLSYCVNLSMEGYVAGFQSGDLQFAFQCITCYGLNYFQSGLPLELLLQDMDKFCQQMIEYREHLALFLNLPLWQCLLNLTGRSEDPMNMEKGFAIDKQHQIGNPENIGAEITWSYWMQIAFYFGKMDKATELADRLKQARIGVAMATFNYPVRIFFFALIAIANFRQTEVRKFKVEAEKHIKVMQELVDAGSVNLVHKLLILRAELRSLLWRDPNKICDAYQEAIQASKTVGFFQDAALTSYLCAQYCSRNKVKMEEVDVYILKAHALWIQWGAIAVAEFLEQRHPTVCRTSFNSDRMTLSSQSSGSSRSLVSAS